MLDAVYRQSLDADNRAVHEKAATMNAEHRSRLSKLPGQDSNLEKQDQNLL
jgi:hypothetical protein